MGRLKHRGHRGALPRLRLDGKASAGLLRRHFKSGTPSPTFRVVRVVKNGSVTRAACSAVIPLPLSMIFSVRVSSALLSSTTICVREAPADREFWAISITFSDSSRMALFVLCQNALDVLGNQAAVNIVVNGDNRSQSAGADAAAGCQRELAVLSALLRFDAQFLESSSKILPEPLT